MTLQYPPEPCREVLVLGAGFSRALSVHMPLTDELGTLAVERAGVASDPRLPLGGFHDGNFETWLSRMAEDQPQLVTAQNRRNEALFLQISEAIHQVLSEKEFTVLSDDAPDWLYVLLSLIHLRRATVITFNYDNLLECGVWNHHLYDSDMGQRVLGDDVINDVPPQPGGHFRYDGSVAQSFRLLKLHGALNWYWSTGDVTGATLNRWIFPGSFGLPVPYDEAARRRQLPGREPFVVPPTATKSAYYANPVTRELWWQAADALHTARRISFVGYSMPPADLMFSGMFSDAIRGRDVDIEIVNPNPHPVEKQVKLLGGSEDHTSSVAGADCVSKFVGGYLDRASAEFVSALKSGAEDDPFLDVPLVLSWGNPANADPAATAVSDLRISPDGSDLELVLERNPPSGGAMAPRFGEDGAPQIGPVLVTLQSLIEALGSAVRIVSKTPDGTSVAFIGAWHAGNNVGYSTKWQVLVPAGRPRGWAAQLPAPT